MLSALWLGITQGLTEFLPISSSGHLALAARLLGISEGGVGLALAAHIGTLLAVVAAYSAALRRLLSRGGRGALLPYLVALVGTAPPALLLASLAERAFHDLRLVALGFLLTSLMLLLTRHQPQEGRPRPANLDALLIGLAQGIAVWPGLSRSGTTIAVGRRLGLSAEAAAEFSFLLLLPTVGGAVLLEAARQGFAAGSPGFMLVTAISSAATGVLSLRWLRGELRRGRFWQFSLYTLLLAGVSFWLG